jgi:Na+-driven multidrug efflux pump
MMPVFILCNMLNSVIRASGSPLWAMLSMLAGAIVNIVLDPIFIFSLDMGMSGAALATVIGQGVSFIMTVLYFVKTRVISFRASSFIPNAKATMDVVRLGASTFVTQLAIVIVAVLCNVQLAKYGLISKYGADIPIAIIGIESKIFTVVINIVVGIALGCQPIISFNMGAKNYARVRQLYFRITACAIATGAIFTLIFELAPGFVIGLFGVPSNIPNPADYWEFGEMALRIFLSLITVSCLIKTNSIFFQAAGKASLAVVSSVARDVVCFTPLILLLPKLYPNVETILYVAPISDCIAMAVTLVMSLFFVLSLSKTGKYENSFSRLDK